jgi:glycosyltransferase involved in cell wall biosynthesis
MLTSSGAELGTVQTPLVSIITPSYMQGEFLPACIASIKAQTYTNFEHLVFDACSTDATLPVLQQHSGTYPLSYVRQRDRGAADAINQGLDRARGEIVCWLNADDAFAGPDVLEHAVRALMDSGASVVTGDGFYMSHDGKRLQPIRTARGATDLAILRIRDPILQPATFWRANRFRLDTTLRYTFDWKLWLDMLEAGERFVYVPEAWALYRVHEHSLTQQDSALRRKEIAEMVRRNGCGIVQRTWCTAVYRGYAASEALRAPLLKRIIRSANKGMAVLSRRHVVSC